MLDLQDQIDALRRRLGALEAAAGILDNESPGITGFLAPHIEAVVAGLARRVRKIEKKRWWKR